MIKEDIINYAKNLGIDEVGFTKAEITEIEKENYKKFLDNNLEGDMNWLRTRFDLKINPKKLLEGAETAIVLAANYFKPEVDLDNKISLYAKSNKDYHKWFKNKLKLISKYLEEKYNAKARGFVDSAPLMEKTLAEQAGIGFRGKHTCIVSRSFGNFLFLGVILTNKIIEIDNPAKNFCGLCNKCLESCPTGALFEPFKINPIRCISYLTIEHKGLIDFEFFKATSNKIFGCDICLKSCHFNKFRQLTNNPIILEEVRFNLSLKDYLDLNEDKFNELFAGTPIKRTGYICFLRNCLIAASNSQSLELLEKIKSYAVSENEILKITAELALKNFSL